MNMTINKSITELVGGTPLLELVNYEAQHNLEASIIAKLEYFNPNSSIKDRIALNIIEEAEASGELKLGTGGTISGVGEFLKEKNPDIKIVAVEPTLDSLSTPELEVDEITGVHPFSYIPKEWVPENFNAEIYDEGIAVTTEQAYETIREVAKTDGVLLGFQTFTRFMRTSPSSQRLMSGSPKLSQK
ncbi:hypothetical protein RyT2_05580 [Pseudolactococcus yaeyamensis]